MKFTFRIFFSILAVVFISYFIVSVFVRSAAPPEVAEPPVLTESPARIYGVVEPAGREVFVSPPVTKRVIKIYVKEGDMVKREQVFCSLENDIEMAQLQLAQAKVESARRTLSLSQDDNRRKKNLYDTNVEAESEYIKALLKMELDQSSLTVARREVELAKASLAQLELKSPIDGKVYKFDVRLGETLSAGDNSRIIVGAPGLWVRLFVESFWLERIKKGGQYKIFHSETNEYLGEGTVIHSAPYMGRRNFRTEDSQERFDTKFQEVVLSLESQKDTIPLGLSVVAELSGE
jgi:RND family efflux transporter MFP subunit